MAMSAMSRTSSLSSTLLITAITWVAIILCTQAITVKIGLITEDLEAVQAAADYMTEIPTKNMSEWAAKDYYRYEIAKSFFPNLDVKFVIQHLNAMSAEEAANNTRTLIEDGCVAIVGAAYSSYSVKASLVATEYKKLLISYTSTSAELSDKTKHAFFMRTVPSDNAQVRFLAESMRLLGVKQFVMIASDDSYGSFALSYMQEYAPTQGLTLNQSFVISDGNGMQQALNYMKEAKITVGQIFLSAEEMNDQILTLMRSNNMWAPPYRWFFSETLGYGFYMVNGNIEISSYYTTSKADNFIPYGALFTTLDSGYWRKSQYLSARVPSHLITDAYAFDAMLLLGRAIRTMLDKGISLSNGEQMVNILKKDEYLGSSGRLMLDENYDRVGTFFLLSNLKSSKFVDYITSWSHDDGLQFVTSSVLLPGQVSVELDNEETIPKPNIWRQVLTVPRARHGAAFGMDTLKAQIILYGGTNNNKIFKNTWIYSCATMKWTQIFSVPNRSPAARTDAAGIYASNYYYLHGGFDGRAYLKDVWRLDTSTGEWTDMTAVASAVIGPPSRSQMGFTKAGSKLYSFGGATYGSYLSDLWVLNLDTMRWELIQPATTTIPPPRALTCIFYNGYFVGIFGGKGSDLLSLNDLWLFNLRDNTWYKMDQINTPTDRFNHRCIVVQSKLYVSGGFSTTDKSNPPDLLQAMLPTNSTADPIEWSSLGTSPAYEVEGTSFVAIDNTLAWFGGWGSKILNSFYAYDLEGSELITVNNHIQVQDGNVKGCSCVAGHIIYVFGGKTTNTDYSTQLTAYNILTQTTSVIQAASGEYPVARYGCGLMSMGDSLYLFGGHGLNDVFYDDFWSFTIATSKWKKIDVQGQKPSPRAYFGYTKFANETMSIIFGGRNMVDQFEDIWTFNFNFMSWNQIVPNTKLLENSIFYASFINPSIALMQNDLELWVAGGASFNDDPQASIFIFNFTSMNWGWLGDKEIQGFPFRIGATLTPISQTQLIIYGGAYYQYILEDVYTLDVAERKITRLYFDQEFSTPPGRIYHVATYFRSAFIVLFGEGKLPLSNMRTNMVIYPDIWQIDFSPVCRSSEVISVSSSVLPTCTLCSKGTFFDGIDCVPCDAGSYEASFGSNACSKCKKGFYNDVTGGTSEKWCLPCPSGTYAPEEGMKACLPCPANYTCYLGTSKPHKLEDESAQFFDTEQPSPVISKASRNLVLTILSYLIAGVISFVLVTVLFLTSARSKKFTAIVERIDFFFTRRHQSTLGPLVLRKTRMGGMFTFVVVLFIVALLITALVPLVDDNIQERRSLVPNFALPSSVTGNWTFVVNVTGEIQSCEANGKASDQYVACDGDISVSTDAMVLSKLSHTSVACMTTSSDGCSVVVQCNTCGTKTDGKVTVSFNDYSYARSYSFEVYTTAAIIYVGEETQSLSRAYGYIHAPNDKLYRGRSVPTIALLGAIQTTFNQSRLGRFSTGFHLDIFSVSDGDTVDVHEFGQRTGFSFAFELVRQATGLEVVYSDKKEAQAVILELLGSVTGIISAMGTLMYYTEAALENLIPKIVKKIRAKAAGKKQEQPTTDTTELSDVAAKSEKHETEQKPSI